MQGLKLISILCLLASSISNCFAQKITAELFSDHIQLSTHAASAGTIEFIVTNQAKGMDHEMVIIKTSLAEDKLPLNQKGNRVDEHALEAIDEVEDLKPEETRNLVVTLKPGHYVLICNIEGHYAAGMHTSLEVRG